MHPVIRIISVVLTIAFLAHPVPGVLLFVATLLLVYATRQESVKIQDLVRYLRGLRWLLITILILYLWMTPGMPIFESEYIPSYLVPSQEGLQIALQRIISLILIVCMVVLFIMNIARAELLAGLCWLTKPLRIFRLDNERLSLRLTLVLDLVPEARATVSGSVKELLQTKPGIQRFSQVFAGMYQQALLRAAETEMSDISIPVLPAPRIWQWLFPAGLVIVFIFLGRW
jgi:energy-coupling factor transport system permease protein